MYIKHTVSQSLFPVKLLWKQGSSSPHLQLRGAGSPKGGQRKLMGNSSDQSQEPVLQVEPAFSNPELPMSSMGACTAPELRRRRASSTGS